jgi:hypothetical protein
VPRGRIGNGFSSLSFCCNGFGCIAFCAVLVVGGCQSLKPFITSLREASMYTICVRAPIYLHESSFAFERYSAVHSSWPKEFSIGRLGASYYFSNSATVGLALLLSVSTVDLVALKFQPNKHPPHPSSLPRNHALLLTLSFTTG